MSVGLAAATTRHFMSKPRMSAFNLNDERRAIQRERLEEAAKLAEQLRKLEELEAEKRRQKAEAEQKRKQAEAEAEQARLLQQAKQFGKQPGLVRTSSGIWNASAWNGTGGTKSHRRMKKRARNTRRSFRR
jgi:hypothetical protein